MGREAECACAWGPVTVQVKVLLEAREMILRGGIRRRLPLTALEQVRVHGEELTFRYSGEVVALSLGSAKASKWAAAIEAPPPSLARKLGITGETSVLLLGEADDEALEMALGEAKQVSRSDGELILARVDTPQALTEAMRAARSRMHNGSALWVIYPKGRGQGIDEATVRAMGRAAGLTDTKVASVSPRLTGLRFIERKA